jgi:CheY-like chemotaxis protein
MPDIAPRRVLVVEDDQDVRELLAEILQEAGYAVSCAANGLRALELLRSGAEQPAVILVDLRMPVMDGVEFCRQKCADNALEHIPVIMMSAAGQLEPRLQQISVQALLKKPMSIEAVLEAVERF